MLINLGFYDIYICEHVYSMTLNNHFDFLTDIVHA